MAPPNSDRPLDASAIVVAAGGSTRMARGGEASDRKPWLDLAGRPLLAWSLIALEAARHVAEIVAVVHPEDVERTRRLAADLGLTKLGPVLPGGATRTASVRLGVAAARTSAPLVAIHDGARPLVESARIDAALEAAATDGSALLARPLADTPKRAADDPPRAHETLDRSGLWAAQTPQCFDAPRLRALLAEHPDAEATDDAALWERFIGPVRLIDGGALNFKVTTPDDLALARALLERRAISGSQQ